MAIPRYAPPNIQQPPTEPWRGTPSLPSAPQHGFAPPSNYGSYPSAPKAPVSPVTPPSASPPSRGWTPPANPITNPDYRTTPGNISANPVAGWKYGHGGPNTGYNEVRKVNQGTGFGGYNWWIQPDSSGYSPYQRWNLTGDWRAPNQSWMAKATPQQMDPWQEAMRSADLAYQQRSRAANDAIALLRAEQDRAVGRSQGYAQQEMADQGLLSSSNAIDKATQYGEKAAQPYLQQIAQQQSELQAYGNEMGEKAALMYQDLGRQGRDELFRNQQFKEMVRQFGVQAAMQWWDMTTAKELGLEQLNPDYKPQWPTKPTGMINGLYSTPGRGYGPTGDVTPMKMLEDKAVPKKGCGPVGDAGDKFTQKPIAGLGKSGARLNLDQNQAQFDKNYWLESSKFNAAKKQNAAATDLANRELELKAASSGLRWNPTTGKYEQSGGAGGFSDTDIAAALMGSIDPILDPKTGQIMGYNTSIQQLDALAKLYGSDLSKFVNLLPPQLASQYEPYKRQQIMDMEKAVGTQFTGIPNAQVVAEAASQGPKVSDLINPYTGKATADFAKYGSVINSPGFDHMNYRSNEGPTATAGSGSPLRNLFASLFRR